jgi:hypothetical protein
VNGFALITSTSSRIRSSQLLMFFGLPLRTAKTTTERLTMPSYASSFHVSWTRPASTSRVTSGSSEKATTDAGRPLSTARLCSPDEAYDCSNSTPAPSSVSPNAGMSSSYTSRGVEYATSVSFASPRPPPSDGPPHAAAVRMTVAATPATMERMGPP